MPRIDAVSECPVFDSFRVQQVAGMFDLSLPAKSRSEFSVEIPGLDESWSIGLIVGPSGSGKSTVARHAFGSAVHVDRPWPADAAVIDGFGPGTSTKDITQMLTAVGFSSPPAWVRPYAALSNGEKFRCDLARALLADQPLVVFDEFTSVVDRTVAKVGSAAVAKAIRSDRIAKRFVAVSCHYDIADWLQPDWVVDMATATLARGRLCRPRIAVEIFACHSAAWKLFARHHYLSSTMGCGWRCYLACWTSSGSVETKQTPVAFVAVAPLVGFKGRSRIARVVVLPDYQGVGIGMRVLHAVAGLIKAEGKRVNITTSHPAMIRGLAASPQWRCVNIAPAGRTGSSARSAFQKRLKPATNRAVVSFEII